MGDAISVSQISRITGIPQGTLRFWASAHHIRAVNIVRGVNFYRLADFKPHLLAWAEQRPAA